MPSNARELSDQYPRTREDEMLLYIRDTLYEGSWDDFIRDLESRAQGRPHVFDTVAPSPTMKATIEAHLHLIQRMLTWESEHGRLESDIPAKKT
jgi:hypothetical protein